jgi:hypothetical protein
VDADERTRDIYEVIDGYPRPLPVPLPAPGDLDSLAEIGLILTPASRAIARAALRASGFDRFLNGLPGTAEALFRRQEQRGAYLFAPAISGTLAIADDPRRPGPFDRAASLLVAARALHDDIRAARLPPDTHRGQVLEMGQYPNLFSTCLIVDEENPSGRIFKSARLDQITVVVGRRLYLLDVPALDRAALPALREALAGLAADNGRLPADELPAGLLTAADHPTQCKIFRQLGKEEVNATSLGALRHSFLTVCLDLDEHPASDAEAAAIAHSRNCANRWYHQSLQVVVFGNGKAAVICNFATYVDGNVMMRGAAELQKRAAAVPLGGSGPALAPARPLSWEIDPGLFQAALQDVRSVQDNQTATFTIDGIGTRAFAAHGIDPIPAFVVALQTAVQRLCSEPIRIKQMLTMARHRCTDFRTAIVSTPEVMRAAENTEERDPAAAAAMLRAAIASQAEACRTARRYVPLHELVALFVATRKGLRWLAAAAVIGGALRLLGLLGLYRPTINQVVISHPAIHPEVPVVGRPGARIPYLEGFTVHYQMMEHRTVITFSPSVVWLVPNAELAAEIEDALRRLAAVAAAPSAT